MAAGHSFTYMPSEAGNRLHDKQQDCHHIWHAKMAQNIAFPPESNTVLPFSTLPFAPLIVPLSWNIKTPVRQNRREM